MHINYKEKIKPGGAGMNMKKYRTILLCEAVLVIVLILAIQVAYSISNSDTRYLNKRIRDLNEIHDKIHKLSVIEPGGLMEAAINEIDDEFTKRVYAELPKIDLPTLEEVNKLKEFKLHNDLTINELRYDSMEPEEFEAQFPELYSTYPSTIDGMITAIAPKMIGALITELSDYSGVEPNNPEYIISITDGTRNTTSALLDNDKFKDGNSEEFTVQTHEVFLDSRKIANIYFAIGDTGFVNSMQLQPVIDRLEVTKPVAYTFNSNQIENSFSIAKILNVNRARQESYGLMQPWCALAAVNCVDSLYNPYSNLTMNTARTVLPIVYDDSNYDCNGIWAEAAKDTSPTSAYNASISEDPLMAKRFRNGLNADQVKDLLGLMSTGASKKYNSTNCGGITSAVSNIKANKPFILSLITDNKLGHASTIIGYIDSDIIIGSDPGYITGNSDLFMLYVNRNKAPNGRSGYLSTIRYFQPHSVLDTNDGILYNINFVVEPNNRPQEIREISYKDVVDYYYLSNIEEVIEKQAEIVPKYFIGDLYRTDIEKKMAINDFISWTNKIYDESINKNKNKNKNSNESFIEYLESANSNNIEISDTTDEELLENGLLDSYNIGRSNSNFINRLNEYDNYKTIYGLSDEMSSYLNNTRLTATNIFMQDIFAHNPEWLTFIWLTAASERIPNGSDSLADIIEIKQTLDNDKLNNRECDVNTYLDIMFSLRRHDAQAISVPSASKLRDYIDDGNCVLLTLEENSNREGENSYKYRRVIMIYGYDQAEGGILTEEIDRFNYWTPFEKMIESNADGVIYVDDYENNIIRMTSLVDYVTPVYYDIVSAVVFTPYSVDKDTYNLEYNKYAELE